RQQRLPQPRLALADRGTPRPRAAHSTLGRALPTVDLSNPTPDRRRRDPRCPHDRRDPAATVRTRLRRRPHPPAALIQLTAHDQPPLPDRAFVDHRPQHGDPNSPPAPATPTAHYDINLGGSPKEGIAFL